MTKLFLFSFLLLFANSVHSQSDTVMYFEEYNPPSSLIVPENHVASAKYPFVDVHNHQWDMSEEHLNQIAEEMKKLNMAVMVNLSGRGFTRIETEP